MQNLTKETLMDSYSQTMYSKYAITRVLIFSYSQDL